MVYMLLIYNPEGFDPMHLPDDEKAAIAADYAAITALDAVTPGNPLGFAADAKTVRVVDGHAAVVDAPWIGGAGVVGGYFMLEAATIEEAVAIAARVPAARLGGAVEIRPCQRYW